MQHIDVVINVFGKPWQTLCTLKSLLKHSSNHIDKIYFVEEKHHPYDDEVKHILDKFDNIIHFTPKEYIFFMCTNEQMDNVDNRNIFRYQYGIENSDKKHVFITHNDILYTGDIIGNMMNEIGDAAGIGLIGQCWNCPAFKSGACNSELYNSYNPTYEDIQEIMKAHPPARYHFYGHLDKERVMPMPECRLNEFACIIDREATNKECYPNGDTPLFGAMDILDTVCAWFKGMVHKGYKFVNYNINKDSVHGYFSQLASERREFSDTDSFFVSGYPTQLNEKLYWEAEQAAKEYYELNLKE